MGAVVYFNPRSRMGSDVAVRGLALQDTISIHAPAWGATRVAVLNEMPFHQFQSTLPHGERLTTGVTAGAAPYFNPRSRMGSDRLTRDPELRTTKFQSTLPHGERPEPPSAQTTDSNFNPRSRMGSDHPFRSTFSRCSHFNPRSRMGSDGGAA